MSITGSLIVYISIWWIVFFSILPIGIKSQNTKFTEDLQGNDPGAPKNPKIAKKFFTTTIITTVLFLILYYLVKKNYLNIRGYLS